MAMPKKRMSHKRSHQRRSHLALVPTQRNLCTNCQQVTLPHRICAHCGYYKGVLVSAPKAA